MFLGTLAVNQLGFLFYLLLAALLFVVSTTSLLANRLSAYVRLRAQLLTAVDLLVIASDLRRETHHATHFRLGGASGSAGAAEAFSFGYACIRLQLARSLRLTWQKSRQQPNSRQPSANLINKKNTGMVRDLAQHRRPRSHPCQKQTQKTTRRSSQLVPEPAPAHKPEWQGTPMPSIKPTITLNTPVQNRLA